MARFNDLTGMYFVRLKVLQIADKNMCRMYNKKTDGHTYWLCQCDCGKLIVARSSHLLSGNITSCGCRQSEISSKTFSEITVTHGLSKTRLYKIYGSMIRRCYKPKAAKYYNYGGRGIYVCDEWYTPGVKGNPGLVAFVKWSYENGFFDYDDDFPRDKRPTLDRIDVNGPYAPWNCRWITNIEQQNNKRNTKYIYDIDGCKYSYANFERKYNLYKGQLHGYEQNGWSLDAMIYAVHHPELKIYKHNGIYYDKDGFIQLIPRYNHDQQ